MDHIIDNFLRKKKMKNHNIKTNFVSSGIRPHWANKTRINLINFQFTIRVYNTIR